MGRNSRLSKSNEEAFVKNILGEQRSRVTREKVEGWDYKAGRLLDIEKKRDHQI